MSYSKRFLTKAALSIRYGKTTRTIDRWINDPASDFPRPIMLNGRKHWEEAVLEEYERGLAAAVHHSSKEAA